MPPTGIEQAGLALREADVVPFGFPERCQQPELLEPLLGQNPQRTVAEADRRVSPRERGQQIGERDRASFEIDLRVQLEPVDPRFDLELELARLMDGLSVGVDLPPLSDQPAHTRTEGLRGDFHVEAAPMRVPQPSEAGLFENLPRGFLSGTVAHHAAAQIALHDRPLGAGTGDARSQIFERHFPLQALVLPTHRRGGCAASSGDRLGGNFFEAQLLGKFQSRQMRHVEQFVDQRLTFIARNLHRGAVSHQRDPLERAVVLQPAETGGARSGIRQAQAASARGASWPLRLDARVR